MYVSIKKDPILCVQRATGNGVNIMKGNLSRRGLGWVDDIKVDKMYWKSVLSNKTNESDGLEWGLNGVTS